MAAKKKAAAKKKRATTKKKATRKKKTSKKQDDDTNDVGRPSLYDPKYCQEIIEFFSVQHFVTETRRITRKDGSVVEEPVRFPNVLPLLGAFAAHIGVHRDTVHEWTKVYPEFNDAHKMAKDLQENMLVTNGLMNLYQPAMAIFTAKNILNWRDKHEHTGKDGGPLETKERIDLSELSKDERKHLAKLLSVRIGKSGSGIN